MNEEVATVFVVDDDPGVRKSLEQLMQSVGLPVETFATGPEFLDRIGLGRPGCLLLDLRLKEGSGLDVQDELCRRRVTLPIIVLTGHGTVPDSVRAMKAGAYDFLQKPPSPAVLLGKIRAALGFDVVARAAADALRTAVQRLSLLPEEKRDVIGLLVAGGTSAETAADLLLVQCR